MDKDIASMFMDMDIARLYYWLYMDMNMDGWFHI